MDESLDYLRRAAGASLEFAGPENDYILSRDGAPAGLENETYWFTFSVPERQLHGAVYLWVHSQLRTATGFVLIFAGVKRYVWQAEHFNCFNYLPYPTFEGGAISLPELGLTLRIVDPHQHHVIAYDDPRSKTSLRLETRALFPAVKAVGRPHLEQPMHVTGDLVLDGEAIAIDSYSMRDRSWRGKRSEAGAIHPPATYCNGISDDASLIFNFNGCDDPERGAPWAGRYAMSREALLLEGWILRDGQLAKATGISKVSTFDTQDFMRQTGWVTELEDELGRKHVIRARRLAAVPFAPWASIFNDWGLYVFEVDGGAGGTAFTNDFSFTEYARTLPLRQAEGSKP